MAEAVPKIRVTDPQSKTSASVNASPSASPAKAASDGFGVDSTLSKLDGDAWAEKSQRPASNGRITPNKLLRNLSSTALGAVSGQAGNDGGSPRPYDPQSPIDPLSQHIMKRIHLHNLNPQKPRSSFDQAASQIYGQGGLGLGDSRHTGDQGRLEGPYSGQREKKKGVSFLSRLIPNKRKDSIPNDNMEDPSEVGDDRPEGIHAELFSQPVDNMGFSPRHPQPPGYIKVRSRNKKEKYFDRLFLAQELRGSSAIKRKRKGTGATRSGSISSPLEQSGAIWSMEFSKDGKYLAAGGQDKMVRVWSVISTMAERRAHENEEDMEEGHEEHKRLSAPVFRKKPVREYEGHTAAVLDLSWSKNNFLLSSSMDKTVRLWHVSRAECLCAFKHSDFVTSIQFHPRDDRFFLAGSLDSKLRLWSIPDKSVAFWNQVPDLITAVAFTPDGKSSIAGCLTGLCVFYETEGMKYQTQIHVRSAHGKNARGSKITGIQAINMPPDNTNGEIKLLITSNDSRVRLYNFRDKSLELKFKGLENSSGQIHATFSDDARFVICGSEDRKAYIWDTKSSVDGGKSDKRPVEMFEAHDEITTVARIAPVKTRQLLSGSEDPVYDLCNPPPVTLVSRSEPNISLQHAENEDDAGSIQQTPATAEGGGTFKKPLQSPAYVARCDHPNGNIVVSADANGRIKVFRQDCAHNKRKADWDASSVFSRRVGTSVLNRSASIATRNSGRSRQESAATQPAADRIMSWRQSVGSTGSIDKIPSYRQGFARAERSMSPRKSNATFSSNSVRTSNGAIHRHPSTPLAETPLSNVSSFTSAPPSEHEHKSSVSTNGTSSSFQSAHGHQREGGSPPSQHMLHRDLTQASSSPEKATHDTEDYIKHKSPIHASTRQMNSSDSTVFKYSAPSSPVKDTNVENPDAVAARWQAPTTEETGPQGGFGGLFSTLNLWRDQLGARNNKLKPPELNRLRSQESTVSKLSSEENSDVERVEGYAIE